MATSALYPAIRPTLNLDFANSKVLDPRFTFSRLSSGTYYDGKTYAKSTENLFLYSQDFSNSFWAKVRQDVVYGTSEAPDKTVTVTRATVNSSSSSGSSISNSVAKGLAGGLTFSIYIKQSTNFVKLVLSNGGSNSAFAFFNLSAGVVGTVGTSGTGYTNVSQSISAANNGFYRCSITVNVASGSSYAYTYVCCNADNDVTCTLGATADLWGAQLEQRSQLTAYAATTAQGVTSYVAALQTAISGVPRFDHDPVTGESLGLLLEEQRSNLILYSEQFSQWSKNGGITVADNQIVSPDGTVSADKLLEGASATPYVTASFTAAVGTTYTASVCVKSAERQTVRLSLTGLSAEARLDISSKTLTAVAGTSGFSDLGDGWYRIWVTGTEPIGGTRSTYLEIYDNVISGFGGLYVWGAQVEVGAFPTSYIKTESSQVTRAADSAVMSGSSFSSWYRQDAGTLFAEGSNNLNGRLMSLNNGTTSERYLFFFASSLVTHRVTVTSGSIAQAGLDIPVSSVSSYNKLCFSYASNSFMASVNGSEVLSDTVGVLPVVDRLTLGYEATFQATGRIKRLVYYPANFNELTVKALSL